MALDVTATDSEVQLPINAAMEQTFLRRAQQLCPYLMGSMPGSIQTQQGSATIKWRRHEQETPSTSALTEITGTAAFGMGRDSDLPSFSDVTATMAKYGQFYLITEEVDLFNFNGTTDDLMDVLGESAGRSLNMLMRNTMEDNATQRFAGNVASDGLVVTDVAIGDINRVINELTNNSARTFTPISGGSTMIGSSPILPGYWAICHPDVAQDVEDITGFKTVDTYVSHTATATGEFGLYQKAGRSVRFVMSEDASVNAGAGGTASGTDFKSTSGQLDIYTIVIYGQDAFGSVGLGMRHTDGVYRAGENESAFQLISHERGSSGVADPFNEMGSIAWKLWFSSAVLNSNWSRAILVGATNLTN